ncbi:NADH-quinone oxidoreductase subunit A [Actinocatenispora comari]|uniref:NADH-quinone oxidoreductase subunit n=1 Tax=Actinocatenispora comari TaxID=2807577 RepID=A0A8J4ERK5_9ACTN|nr:NADH-quinone oxidoreductase subunit A [Actinocatenispora comari]GIL30969.1 NADH-quinone oxidoreductase subunit A 1 [Actinocatenispora comari]
MTAVLLVAGVASLAVLALYGVGRLVRVAAQGAPRAPFLSGNPPVEHALSRYHVRWYTVTMLFLAFDMEMVFMYPWTLVVATVGASAVIEMFAFLAVLFAGVLYAWREGALRWV